MDTPKPLNRDMGVDIGAYFDYASSSPVDPRVVEKMLPYMTHKIGNPASVHSWSRDTKMAVEEAREKILSFVGGIRGGEEEGYLVFTASPTESNNLVIKGVARKNRKKGKHIVFSAIEHWSVYTPIKALMKEGFEATKVPVNSDGFVDPSDVESAIRDDTVLVTIMTANNEIGTVQPIKEIGEICRERGVLFHTDATSALGKMGFNVTDMNVDLATLPSNEIYGPKGIAALYIRKGVRPEPIIHGGGQEFGLRSGTENVPGIVGMAGAVEILEREMDEEVRRLGGLRDILIDGLLGNIPGSALNGAREPRLPNNVNVRFPFVEGEAIVLGLDMYGVAAASGSACSSKTLEPSHVLTAIGLPHEVAHGSLQLTLGRWTKKEHVEHVLEVLPGVVRRLQAMSPLTPPGWIKEHWGKKNQNRR